MRHVSSCNRRGRVSKNKKASSSQQTQLSSPSVETPLGHVHCERCPFEAECPPVGVPEELSAEWSLFTCTLEQIGGKGERSGMGPRWASSSSPRLNSHPTEPTGSRHSRLPSSIRLLSCEGHRLFKALWTNQRSLARAALSLGRDLRLSPLESSFTSFPSS